MAGDGATRRASLVGWIGLVVALVASSLACTRSTDGSDVNEGRDPVFRSSSATAEDPLTPLTALEAFDANRVALGKRMFFDPRISGDGSVSCESCHFTDKGGCDGRVHPKLETRPEGVLNSPSIYNLAYDYRYNWSGRFDDLGAQLDANLRNPLTMASSWAHVVRKLGQDPGYVSAFRAAYPGGLNTENARDALVVYQLSLVTVNSRFDRYLRGEREALDTTERQGYALFKRYGCISCHQGVNIGGNMLQRFGVMRDYFADRGDETEADLGRFVVTRDERDRHVFRVPSLRNVERTAPYFHDGSAPTLEDAVDVMARYQLGRSLEGDDADRIVAFLKTLTGTLDGKPL